MPDNAASNSKNPSGEPPKPAQPVVPSRTVITKGKYAPPMAAPPKYVPMKPRFESHAPAVPKPVATHPKKVRGGVRLPSGEVAPISSWSAQRWMRLMEECAAGPNLVEGLEYSREGQTKRWIINPGKIEGQVQGRSVKPYDLRLTIEPIAPDQWDKVVSSMSENAVYAAKLLAGELPSSIEDVFVPLGLKLFPAGAEDVKVRCSCGHSQRPRGSVSASAGVSAMRGVDTNDVTSGWCKHACCLAYLLAHRLGSEPFLIFSLRGLDYHDLVERLRARRAVVGAALGATPIYQQRVAGVSDVKSAPLEDSLGEFWDMGESAKQLDLPLEPPAVSHPLLRRLGQSPWTGQATFPLVGLLASCYDTISEQAMREEK